MNIQGVYEGKETALNLKRLKFRQVLAVLSQRYRGDATWWKWRRNGELGFGPAHSEPRVVHVTL